MIEERLGLSDWVLDGVFVCLSGLVRCLEHIFELTHLLIDKAELDKKLDESVKRYLDMRGEEDSGDESD